MWNYSMGPLALCNLLLLLPPPGICTVNLRCRLPPPHSELYGGGWFMVICP